MTRSGSRSDFLPAGSAWRHWSELASRTVQSLHRSVTMHFMPLSQGHRASPPACLLLHALTTGKRNPASYTPLCCTLPASLLPVLCSRWGLQSSSNPLPFHPVSYYPPLTSPTSLLTSRGEVPSHPPHTHSHPLSPPSHPPLTPAHLARHLAGRCPLSASESNRSLNHHH